VSKAPTPLKAHSPGRELFRRHLAKCVIQYLLMSEASSTPTVAEIGKHSIHIQGGILHVLFSGRVSAADAVAMRQRVCDAGDRFGKLGALVALDGLSEFDAGARTHFARADRPYPFYATAFYGGSFGARMLVTTILRAGSRIAPRMFPFPFEIFKTEAEARIYLTGLRPPPP